MKSIYENTGKGYTMQGDYVLPNIETENKAEYKIGVWGSVGKHLRQKLSVAYLSALSLQAGCLYSSVIKTAQIC